MGSVEKDKGNTGKGRVVQSKPGQARAGAGQGEPRQGKARQGRAGESKARRRTPSSAAGRLEKSQYCSEHRARKGQKGARINTQHTARKGQKGAAWPVPERMSSAR